jgi:putative flippase GtrA
VFVGALAFVVDFSVLYLSKTFLFSALGDTGILFSAALGFIAGLVFNYILSIVFVFKQNSETVKRHKIRSFVLFAVIGIIGLFITELCMFAGISVLGSQSYPAVKVITAGIVLIWNFVARKTLIFKGVKDEQR